MYLNSLGLPRKSSAIFGNFRKMFGNFRLALRIILENLWKSSESGRKSSEIMKKHRHYYVYILKEHYGLPRGYEFYALVARTISRSFAALTRVILFLLLEQKIHILSPPCNILYILALLIRQPYIPYNCLG